MIVFLTAKNKEDPIKKEAARMAATLKDSFFKH